MTLRRTLVLQALTLCLTACNGLFDEVYDVPSDVAVPQQGVLSVDASSWTDWHYIDLHAVVDSLAADSLYNASSAWHTVAIPTEADVHSTSREGIYTYWYDVFGAGLTHNEFREFRPTAPQAEPERWDIAVHRNNVRTHGGTAAATHYLSLDELPENADFCAALTFTPDTWTVHDVWTVQDRMLLGLIGNQGICVNEVLSSWLSVNIPPVPPTFALDSRVFVLRMADGTYAALQLVDYQNAMGTKCWLTIRYKYPL